MSLEYACLTGMELLKGRRCWSCDQQQISAIFFVLKKNDFYFVRQLINGM